MKYLTYILLLSFLFSSCSTEEGLDKPEYKNIEILLSVNQFTKSGTEGEGKTDPGTTEEQKIDNLYLFLFSTTGTDVKRYYITGEDSRWNKEDGKITLDLTQPDAGTRNVYVVANCAAIETRLDNISSPDDLKDFFTMERAKPWSPDLTTPILMVGNKNHNFVDNARLDKISLTRAIAKLKLNITLSADQQAAISEYKYRFVNFDKSTYVLKPVSKPENKTNSEWFELAEIAKNGHGLITTEASNKVFAIETYLNESDVKDVRVEMTIPDKGNSELPPPEFGDEVYRLLLPDSVVRNTYYLYDISF